MTDKYDEMAKKLLPCQLLPGCYTASERLHNYDCCAWKRPTVAAALREKGDQNERLTYEISVIGNMAVVDFDDAVVGAVNKAVPVPPKNYAEMRRAELDQVKALKAEIDRLRTGYGQAIADLMGCRDGALVRDLRAQNERQKIVIEKLLHGNEKLREALADPPPDRKSIIGE